MENAVDEINKMASQDHERRDNDIKNDGNSPKSPQTIDLCKESSLSGDNNIKTTGSGASHVLVEFSSLDELTLPIKASTRIKYTCISVSQNFIAIGTNTGALYMFARADQRYIQAIQADTGSLSVTKLVLGPVDQLLAYTTSAGIVTVIEHNAGRREKVDKLRTSKLHQGTEVTSLVWNEKGTRVYVGDSKGVVSLINVSRELFKFSSETMMKFDSTVLQIDAHGEQVLVSTATRCYLGNTVKQQFSSIGKKLREIPQGGCFYVGSGLERPLVYCPRPGSRMWEVDSTGAVLNTHQFKHILDTPPTGIVQVDPEGDFKLSSESPGPQSIAFRQLHVISYQYLVSLCDKGLFIFNPSTVKLLLWNDQVTLKDVLSYTIRKHELYLLTSSHIVKKYTLIPVYKLLQTLVDDQQYSLGAKLSLSFTASLLNESFDRKHYESNVFAISTIVENLLQQGDVKLAEQLKCLIADVKISSEFDQVIAVKKSAGDDKLLNQDNVQTVDEKSNFKRNDSGIFVSRTRTLSFESSGNFSEVDKQTLLERIHSTPVQTSSIQKKPDLDTISQSSETSQDDGKIEGNWGLKNKAQVKIGKAQNTLLGLKNKLKGKLTRKDSLNDKDAALKSTEKSNSIVTDSPVINRKLSLVENLAKENSNETEGIVIGQEVDSTEATPGSQSKNVDSIETNQTIDNFGENKIENSDNKDSSEFDKVYRNADSVIEDNAKSENISKVENNNIVNDDVHSKTLPTSSKMNSNSDFDLSTVKVDVVNVGTVTGQAVSVQTSTSDSNLTRMKSSDSLYSARSSDKASSEDRSRDLSISSGEILSNTTSLGPEPLYKKTYGVQSRRSQKKKPAIVSFGDDVESFSALSSKSKKSKSDKKKSKKPKRKQSSDLEIINIFDDEPSSETANQNVQKYNADVSNQNVQKAITEVKKTDRFITSEEKNGTENSESKLSNDDNVKCLAGNQEMTKSILQRDNNDVLPSSSEKSSQQNIPKSNTEVDHTEDIIITEKQNLGNAEKSKYFASKENVKSSLKINDDKESSSVEIQKFVSEQDNNVDYNEEKAVFIIAEEDDDNVTLGDNVTSNSQSDLSDKNDVMSDNIRHNNTVQVADVVLENSVSADVNTVSVDTKTRVLVDNTRIDLENSKISQISVNKTKLQDENCDTNSTVLNDQVEITRNVHDNRESQTSSSKNMQVEMKANSSGILKNEVLKTNVLDKQNGQISSSTQSKQQDGNSNLPQMKIGEDSEKVRNKDNSQIKVTQNHLSDKNSAVNSSLSSKQPKEEDAKIVKPESRLGEIVVRSVSEQPPSRESSGAIFDAAGNRVVYDPPLVGRSVSTPSFDPPGHGLPPNRSSLSKLNSVKEKLSSRAKSIVQTLKDTKEKITLNRDLQQPPLDVVVVAKQVEEVESKPTVEVRPDENAVVEDVVRGPLVDLADLREATSTALKKLLEIDKNPDEASTDRTAVLQSWVGHLHKAMKKLELALLGEVLQSWVGHLHEAMKELELALLGEERISNTLNDSTALEQGETPSNTEISKASENNNIEDKKEGLVPESSSRIVENRNHPTEEKTTETYKADDSKEEICCEAKNQDCQCNVRENDSEKSYASLKSINDIGIVDMMCVVDPFDMDERLHKDVTYLASLCFENACYGDRNCEKMDKNKFFTNKSKKLSKNTFNGSSVSGKLNNGSSDHSKVLSRNVNYSNTLSGNKHDRGVTIDKGSENEDPKSSETSLDNLTGNLTNDDDQIDKNILSLKLKGNEDVVPDQDFPRDSTEVSVNLNHENVTIQDDSSEEVRNVDADMHMFLGCYFHCIDSTRAHRCIMGITDQGRRKQAWDVLVKCLTAASVLDDTFSQHMETSDFDSAWQSLQDLATDGATSCQLGYFYRLFHLDPKTFVCLPAPPVDPVDVLYMCSDYSTTQWRHLVLDYVNTQLSAAEGQLDSVTVLSHLCGDPEVYVAVLETLLTVDRPEVQTNCTCGEMPRPLSHLLPWTRGHILVSLLTLHTELIQRKLQLCQQYGFWRGYLSLLSCDSSSDRLEMAALILQLNDHRVLSGQYKAKFIRTEEEWVYVLSLMHKLTTRGSTSQSLSFHRGFSNLHSSHYTREADITEWKQGHMSVAESSPLLTDERTDDPDLPVDEVDEVDDDDESSDDCPVFVFNSSCEELHQANGNGNSDRNGGNSAECKSQSIHDNPNSLDSVMMKDVKINDLKSDYTVKNEESDNIHKVTLFRQLYCLHCGQEVQPCDITGSNQFSSHTASSAFNSNHSKVCDSKNIGQRDYFSFPEWNSCNSNSDWLSKFDSANENKFHNNNSNKDSDWMSVFQSSNPKESDNTENKSGPHLSISWAMLAQLLVDTVGTRRAFKVLFSMDVPLSSLPLQFYRDCVTYEVLHNQHRRVHQLSLEKLDRSVAEKFTDKLSDVQVIQGPESTPLS